MSDSGGDFEDCLDQQQEQIDVNQQGKHLFNH